MRSLHTLIRFPYPTGLKINALLILLILFVLTGVFAVRTQNVARFHFLESKSSVEKDIPLQNLLFHLDSALHSKQQIQKKWNITRDPAYQKMNVKYRELIEDSIREINILRPGLLAMTSKTPFAQQQHQLRKAQEMLTAEREFSVQRAREVAEGLLKLMWSAIALSVVVTGWLVLLLYRGLLRPLQQLRESTTRIREGELSCRMDEAGVTELREIAQDFNSMAGRLEALDQAKSEFLATISHEIKNPLAALKEGLALLSSTERRRSEESEKKCLMACVIASKRLEFMINNLLKLSQPDPTQSAGILERDFAPRNICAALQNAIDEVRPLAERKSMDLRFAGPESLVTSFHWDGMVQAFVNHLLYDVQADTHALLFQRIGATVKAIENSRNLLAGDIRSRVHDLDLNRWDRRVGGTER